MDTTALRVAQQYIKSRKQNPAWVLLSSRRAPLVMGCLNSLFKYAQDGVLEADALIALTEMLNEFAYHEDYDINPETTAQLAGKELREWLKKGLIIERGGRIYATDALHNAMAFADSLDDRIMTTTASRLSVVQREIENLEVGLNPSPESRIATLKRQISVLEYELERAQAGHVPVLSKEVAVERIREVYGLAMGLRADFRRVEDSWRDADRSLRQSIVTEQYHRGEIVDRLLDGQEQLLQTPEGRVFDTFQEQLRQSIELDSMHQRIKTIIKHPAIPEALSIAQVAELRHMRLRLVSESQSVLQARARGERDVKGFLKTGLAAEHHRVGELLNDIFATALEVDFSKQKNRRAPSPLQPIGFTLGALPTPERLRFKQIDADTEEELNLTEQSGDLTSIDDDFWEALEGLDRLETLQQTLKVIAQWGKPVTLRELAEQLPPVHDLETFALWIGMAQEAGIEVNSQEIQKVDITDADNNSWQFTVPWLEMSDADLTDIEWEL